MREVEFHRSIEAVTAAEWNALGAAANPFTRHEFLLALEQTQCVGGDSGWEPRYLTLRDAHGLAGAAAAFVKTHSYGEFVFDFAWARGYERLGRRYYPKLTLAAPFTPATGPRLLVRAGAHQQPRTGRGRERCGQGELGVVAAPEPLVATRPGEVEHELTVGMGLDEGRRGPGEPVRIAQRQIARLPAAVAADALRLLECQQKLVTREGIGSRAQRIPLGGRDGLDAAVKLDLAHAGGAGQRCDPAPSDSR